MLPNADELVEIFNRAIRHIRAHGGMVLSRPNVGPYAGVSIGPWHLSEFERDGRVTAFQRQSDSVFVFYNTDTVFIHDYPFFERRAA
jgi:hypothetical protein